MARLKLEDRVKVICYGREGIEARFVMGTKMKRFKIENPVSNRKWDWTYVDAPVWQFPRKQSEGQKYLRGLRKILKQCANVGFFEGAGQAYVGRDATSNDYVWNKFFSIKRLIGYDGVMQIADGARLSITSYVNGTFDAHVA